MTQATLELATTAHEPADRVGFAIGWDHAHHGLVPPADLLRFPGALAQGWHAARAVFGGRTLAAPRPVRLWLELRLEAWLQGTAFELQQLTPNHIKQIEVTVCPVTRRPLGGARAGADAPRLVRLREDAGYAAGNLVMLSRVAADARVGFGAERALAQGRRLGPGETARGLDADAWARLAALVALSEPLPFARSVRVPLRLLPPNRVRVLNAASSLQAVLTLLLAQPGWTAVVRALAADLGDAALRHDLHLLVGAFVPRLLEALRHEQGRPRRQALEDAWADARLQRRWQQFALQLGESGCERLAARVAALGGGNCRIEVHARDAAVDGWALRCATARAA